MHSRPVRKGLVREELVSALSRQPARLTDLARLLGVSKATVEYHLSALTARGLVEVLDYGAKMKGPKAKVYTLRRGTVFAVPSSAEESSELRAMEEAFEVSTLGWGSRTELPDGRELTHILYLLFLHLFRVTRVEHPELMRSYGRRAGLSLAHAFLGGKGLQDTLSKLRDIYARLDIATLETVSNGAARPRGLIFGRCLYSQDHPTEACFFLEGFTSGLMQTRFGPTFQVMRVSSELPACVLVAGAQRSLRESGTIEAVMAGWSRYNKDFAGKARTE